jgi:hypothetical protein
MLRLVKTVHAGLTYPKSYTDKPACALWKDTPQQLLLYGVFLAREAANRKLPDPRDHTWIEDEYKFRGNDLTPPWWLGDKEWHSYHRGLMHQNDELFYTAVFIKTGVGVRFDDKYSRESIFESEGDLKARMTAFHVNQLMRKQHGH